MDGVEVYRGNLYPGPPHPDRPAAGVEPVEGQPHGFTIEPSVFDDGKGVIAIQIHQTREADRGNEADLWFRFMLTEPAPSLGSVLERLPHDQMKAFFGDLLSLEQDSPSG